MINLKPLSAATWMIPFLVLALVIGPVGADTKVETAESVSQRDVPVSLRIYKVPNPHRDALELEIRYTIPPGYSSQIGGLFSQVSFDGVPPLDLGEIVWSPRFALSARSGARGDVTARVRAFLEAPTDSLRIRTQVSLQLIKDGDPSIAFPPQSVTLDTLVAIQKIERLPAGSDSTRLAILSCNSADPAEQQAFNKLYQQAIVPQIVDEPIKDPTDRHGFETFVFRMSGTRRANSLNASEILFAFLEEVPKPDLISSPDYFVCSESHTPIIYQKATRTTYIVKYEELALFKDDYDSFMNSAASPLRLQATGKEFHGKLQSAHEQYRRILDDSMNRVYDFSGDVLHIEDKYYNFENSCLVIPINGYDDGNRIIMGLVSNINGDCCCSHCTSVHGTYAIWKEFVDNYDDIKEIVIPMGIDEAESWINNAREFGGEYTVLYRNAGIMKERFYTTNRSTVGVRVLGIRLVVGSGTDSRAHCVVFE